MRRKNASLGGFPLLGSNWQDITFLKKYEKRVDNGLFFCYHSINAYVKC